MILTLARPSLMRVSSTSIIWVPPKEAHESSGHSWDSERRKAYANDLSDSNILIAVDRGLNRQKGAGDPVQIGYSQIKLIRKNMRELG